MPNEDDRGHLLSEALSHMIDALGLEVAAIRKKGGGTQVERVLSASLHEDFSGPA